MKDQLLFLRQLLNFELYYLKHWSEKLLEGLLQTQQYSAHMLIVVKKKLVNLFVIRKSFKRFPNNFKFDFL